MNKLNKPEYDSFLFHENGSEPFPIQRIKWLEKILPEIKSVMSTIKKTKGSNTNENLLTDLIYTSDLLEKELKYGKDTIGAQQYHDLIKATTYNTTFMYNWNVFKQSYKFDKDTFNLLCNDTDIDELPLSIINNTLPYPAFFIDNKFVSNEGKVFRGCFVSVLYDPKGMPDLGLLFIEDNAESDYEYCLIPLYMGDMTLIEVMLKRDERYGVESSREDIDTITDLGSKALKAIIYICSANSEIETIKVSVANNSNNKKKSKNKNKKPTTISQNLVGYRMGNTIRKTKKVYVYDNGNSDCKDNTKKKSTKSPHMRMAHYHHFWTGPKNEPDKRKLILKYIPPLFISSHNADKEIHSTLHKVK